MTSHMNGMYGPSELRGVFFDAGVTHEHVCLFHTKAGDDQIQSGGVQTARKIDPDFESFEQTLKYVCDTLNFENWADIPPPKDQGDLF